jgi:hypothetical protein
VAGTDGSDLIATIERWYAAGAVWRVVDRRPDEVTVALLRCDGGEEVERISSGAPAWLDFLAERETSED